ncbi:(d)CMP kinase [Aerococcaceae bacterium WGS1372]
METIQIAVDGPASSGKSTVSQIIAEKLNLIYIDTGAMYRAVTLAVLDQGITVSDFKKVESLLSSLNLEFQRSKEGNQEIYLNGKNVSKEIRTDRVTENVSEISAYPFVREFLVEKQRAMAVSTSVIMDGRDIGTVVLPEADFKFYLNASAKVRAKRRYLENIKKGLSNQSLEEIERAIIERDTYDSNREHSPLKKASDAISINTDLFSVEEVVEEIIKQIKGYDA